jgi:V/A-type H+-transporting ATPase subunit D
MAETARGSASRADLLELKREHEVVEEGHRFLDEKRVLLARELLTRIARCERLQRDFDALEQDAHQALIEATGALGLEELQLYPPRDGSAFSIRRRHEGFLGIRLPLLGPAGNIPAEPIHRPVIRRPVAEAVASAFASLLEAAIRLAAEHAGLLRVEAEYRKTQRRVRALEKIMLPELVAAERALEAALEEQELEEAVRVRLAVKK